VACGERSRTKRRVSVPTQQVMKILHCVQNDILGKAFWGEKTSFVELRALQLIDNRLVDNVAIFVGREFAGFNISMIVRDCLCHYVNEFRILPGMFRHEIGET
jgi:hypothetical protein